MTQLSFYQELHILASKDEYDVLLCRPSYQALRNLDTRADLCDMGCL